MSKITDIYDESEKAVDKAIVANRNRIAKSIKQFEKNIIDMAHDILGVGTGDIVKKKALKTAIELHKSLINEFEETYGKAALTVSDELKSVATIIRNEFKGLDIPLSFTTVDKDMFEAVRKSVANGYIHLGEDTVSKIMQSIYDSVITGQSFSTLVESIQSNTGMLNKNAQLRAHDSLMNYYTILNVKKAGDAGIETFLYYGNIIAASRPFCIVRAGKVYTLEQIQKWDSMSWAGKKPGPTIINRGGYRCRHSWHACKSEWVEDGKIDVQNWYDESNDLSPNQIKEVKAEENKLNKE